MSNYYTTTSPITIDEFIAIEVHDRKNYVLWQVLRWCKKYSIDNSTELLWVARYPWTAARYQMPASDWDDCKEIYMKNKSEYHVRTINSNSGTLIKESDDGDDGFLFILK